MLKRAFAFTCVLAVPLAAEAARPVTFDDIMQLRRIETPAISPDGAHVLYVVRQLGGGDYRDIITGVDALIARGIADPDRLAILGWSYGGYMTAWAITQTSRFKAAMVGAGLTNLWSMYGSNDIPNTLAAYFDGLPNPANLPLYLERSALTHAAKVTTPTLFLHGAADERVPIGQPMEFYRALKDRGVATELVFYPRAGHGLTEYYHLLDRLQRQFAWITTHVGAKRTTSP